MGSSKRTPAVSLKSVSYTHLPVAPPNRMFIIPGNNTGSGLLQNLIDSDGTGIICESEADTVSTAIGTEFGNWSDTLRKACLLYTSQPICYLL